jgi:TPR repeat protein
MSIKNLSTGLTLSLLLASGVASADYNSALSAYSSGDYKAAFKEMLPLAEQGNIDAQFWIADMYDSGKGVPENDKAAVKWYTLSAEQGDKYAEYQLGLMYDNGEGVQRTIRPQ